ncbi:MAG: methyl-accepting chemotaxis protein [Candidatus Heimdallarchaeota archaeon]|nr:methyl-accepting chemotaxis protein [Candidatus Heimdallarchaeota archaeon]
MQLFSIRNRMIFLAVFVIAGLFIQNTLVADSLVMINKLNEQGDAIKSKDNRIIENLIQADEAIHEYAIRELELIVVELLLTDMEIPDAGFVLNSIKTAFDESGPVLLEREISNYEIDVESVGFYSYFSVDTSIFRNTSTIIDSEETGAYATFNTIRNVIYNNSEDLADEANALNIAFRRASKNIYELSTGIGNYTHGSFGNITTEYTSMVENLDSTDDYNFDLLNKFSDLYLSVTKAFAALTKIQTLGFGRDTEIDEYERLLINEYNETVIEAENEFLSAELAINSTVGLRQSENDTLMKIVEVFKDQMIPDLYAITVNMNNYVSASDNLEIFFTDDLVSMMDDYVSYLEIILDILSREQSAFVRTFANILEQFTEQLNSILLQASLVLIGIISLFLTIFIISIVRSMSILLHKFNAVAVGDLSGESKKSYSSNEFGELEKNFDEVVVQLREALSTIKVTSERLSGIAEELAAGAEEASSSVKEVSDTMREFSGGASEQNILLSRINDKLKSHLKDVNNASDRIGETSSFVLKVAKRTNILGLNAGIAAAKAGKYGKGFSIVAREVRSLSDSTKGSANEIANIIDEIQFSITTSVEDILKEVDIIRTVAENTAAGSEEVSAAALEQVTMLSEISETSTELAYLSQELNNAIHKFKLELK